MVFKSFESRQRLKINISKEKHCATKEIIMRSYLHKFKGNSLCIETIIFLSESSEMVQDYARTVVKKHAVASSIKKSHTAISCNAQGWTRSFK